MGRFCFSDVFCCKVLLFFVSFGWRSIFFVGGDVLLFFVPGCLKVFFMCGTSLCSASVKVLLMDVDGQLLPSTNTLHDILGIAAGGGVIWKSFFKVKNLKKTNLGNRKNIPSLKTNSLNLKIGPTTKGFVSLPTIHFQVLLLIAEILHHLGCMKPSK